MKYWRRTFTDHRPTGSKEEPQIELRKQKKEAEEAHVEAAKAIRDREDVAEQARNETGEALWSKIEKLKSLAEEAQLDAEKSKTDAGKQEVKLKKQDMKVCTELLNWLQSWTTSKWLLPIKMMSWLRLKI